MVSWSAAKRVGLLGDLINSLVFTTMKLSVPLSSLLQSVQFSVLLYPAPGRSTSWMSPIHQLDVTNAFLHGTLSEPVYCEQPSSFVDPLRPEYVCKLHKALYGVKQAPRAWFQRFANHLISLGFVNCKSDTSLFVYHRGSMTAYLLLYVDDIILTAFSPHALSEIISALCREFDMKDLGVLHYFLGISVTHQHSGLFLSQHKYLNGILDRQLQSVCHSFRHEVEIIC